MASDDRTEKPTGKRRQDARAKGQVARSQDVNSTAGLLAVFAALVVGGPHMHAALEAMVARGLAQSGDPHLAGSDGLAPVASWAMRSFAGAVAPAVGAAAVTGIVANLAQVRLRLTLHPLQPSFSTLNPTRGLKRIFGPAGVVETVKALAKLAVVGGFAFLAVWPRLPHLGALVGIPPDALLSRIAGEVRSIVLRVGAVLAVLAVLDWLWQRRRMERSLRMTKQEVKQEARQTDVAPEVRGALRRKQLQQARRRMLADVPTADVVVVNPTHFAVALRYDGSLPAPEVVAKGADLIAAAIRAAAEEHGVPIVHDPPLARTLYRQVELGAMIPEAMFAAVAEVLAYVYRTAGRRARARSRSRRALPAAAR